jgi:hypothetical protein
MESQNTYTENATGSSEKSRLIEGRYKVDFKVNPAGAKYLVFYDLKGKGPEYYPFEKEIMELVCGKSSNVVRGFVVLEDGRRVEIKRWIREIKEHGLQKGIEDVTNIIRERLGATDEAKFETVGELIQHVKSNKRVLVESVIYAYLANSITGRHCEQRIKMLKERDQLLFDEYQDNAGDVLRKEDPKYQIHGKFPYFQIGYDYDGYRQRECLTAGKDSIRVCYKQYFSFVPVSKYPDEVMAEMLCFISVFPDLARELVALAKATNDAISFKTNGDIIEMISHLDNLVVYHNDPSNGQKIRDIVNKVMSKARIHLDRKGRVEAGFDFKSSEGKRDICNGSHSELISRVLCDSLMEHYKKTGNIPHPIEKFIAKLDAESLRVGKLTPQEMLARLVKIKKKNAN